MATRTGSAVWEGTLKQGKGTTKLGSGALEGPYSFSSLNMTVQYDGTPCRSKQIALSCSRAK